MCALAITLSKRGASVTGTASGARAYKMAMDTIWLLLLAVSVNVKSCGVIAAGPALPGSTVTLTCSSKPFSSGVVCIAPAGTMPTLLNTPATSARCIPAARAARQHRAGAAGNSSTSSSSGVAARRHVVRATAVGYYNTCKAAPVCVRRTPGPELYHCGGCRTTRASQSRSCWQRPTPYWTRCLMESMQAFKHPLTSLKTWATHAMRVAVSSSCRRSPSGRKVRAQARHWPIAASGQQQ